MGVGRRRGGIDCVKRHPLIGEVARDVGYERPVRTAAFWDADTLLCGLIGCAVLFVDGRRAFASADLIFALNTRIVRLVGDLPQPSLPARRFWKLSGRPGTR